MFLTQTVATEMGTVHLACTGVGDGDFAVLGEQEALAKRRSLLSGQPWTWLRQVHGSTVVQVSYAGEHAGAEADGAVTSTANSPLAVVTADCAPVALIGSKGFAVVHAGWRGVVAGVIDRATRLLAEQGSEPVATVLGPCIQPAVYEFGSADLGSLVDSFGASVRSVTSDGKPALDLPALVAQSCRRAGWTEPTAIGGGPLACTSGPGFYSHRARGDTGRQTMVGWLTS